MWRKMKNTVPNIWETQENLIRFYKLAVSALLAATLFLLVVALALAFRNPVVVVKEGSSQSFYIGKRAGVEIQKTDVEAFTAKVLQALYVWPEFKSELIGKRIAPFAEAALVEKITAKMGEKYKDFKDKKLSEEIAFLSVEVSDDQVACRFDRVLKIEGIPLVIPTEMTFALLRGEATEANPSGIYVSGITEHETK